MEINIAKLQAKKVFQTIGRADVSKFEQFESKIERDGFAEAKLVGGAVLGAWTPEQDGRVHYYLHGDSFEAVERAARVVHLEVN
jgi:hypothetical protein